MTNIALHTIYIQYRLCSTVLYYNIDCSITIVYINNTTRHTNNTIILDYFKC